jgi:hypothetical protein
MELAQFFAAEEARHGISRMFETTSRVAPNIPIQKIETLQYSGAKEVSLGEVGARLVNETPAATQGSVIAPVNEKVAMLYTKIATDHRFSAEVRAVELARRSRNIARAWDHYILNGQGNTDAKQVTGLRYRATGAQLIAETNGGYFDLALFESFLDACEDFGGPRFVFCNKTVARQIKRAILGEAGGASVADVTQAAFDYEGWKIVPLDRKHDNTPVLPFTETQGVSNVTSSMYAVCTSPEERVGVKLLLASNSIEVIEEGTRDLQRIDYVELAFGLAVHDDRAIARYAGLLETGP